MKLEGKVALITGSASGLGQTSSQLFAKEGAKVIVADYNDKAGHETVKMIKGAGGEATFVHVDLRKMVEIEGMVNEAVGAFGKIDIFFHNAGIPGPGSLDSTVEEDYDECMAVNLKAAFFGAKYAAREIRKVGGGSILFTSSGRGMRPSAVSPTYSVSKAGLIMLARCLAYYLAKDNIRVNCILPGMMRTPFWSVAMSRDLTDLGLKAEQIEQSYLQGRALKRFGTTEEVAQGALFLVSPEASFITGIALPVDGGGVAG